MGNKFRAAARNGQQQRGIGELSRLNAAAVHRFENCFSRYKARHGQNGQVNKCRNVVNAREE